MSQLTPEEEEKILHSSPKGTYALMLLLALAMAAGWALLFFGRFLAHGPIS